MNKCLFAFVVILITYGCTPKKFSDYTVVTIINESSKKIFFYSNVEISGFDIPSAERTLLKMDSIIINTNEQYNLEYQTIVNYRYGGISIDSMAIFNLIDTTSMKYNRDSLHKLFFYIIQNPIIKYAFSYDNPSKYNHVYSIKISSDLLTLFQKDTSMLTKFKDYYNK